MMLLFFKEHPSHSALSYDISVELSPFAVKSMFWLRSGPITLQEITYPDLVVARTAQYEISGKNHICSAKTFSSKPQSTHQRRKMHWDKQHFPWGKSHVLPTDPLFIHYQVLRAKQPRGKLLAIKIPAVYRWQEQWQLNEGRNLIGCA